MFRIQDQEELQRLLQDTDASDTSYQVEECMPLVAKDLEEVASQQLKRICNESQEPFRGAICRFFRVLKTFPVLKTEGGYSTMAYISTCTMQPLQLGDKDRLRLSQLVLYHSSPEVVIGAFQALANGLRCCPSLQLELSSFVPSYLIALGAVEAGMQAEANSSLVADLVYSSVCQGGMYYFPYNNFASFLDLILLELELRPNACPPRFLSQLCRWCLLMLMDDQMLVFSIALEKVFLACFEELAAHYLVLAEELVFDVAFNISSRDPGYHKLTMLAQSLLLDSFPVASKISQVNFLLQRSRAKLALVFLEQSFNPTIHPDNSASISVEVLFDA
ncbi:hypothetical protein L0F63_004456, partial [Massospora cicadina]